MFFSYSHDGTHPKMEHLGLCVSLNGDSGFYFKEENCELQKSPICTQPINGNRPCSFEGVLLQNGFDMVSPHTMQTVHCNNGEIEYQYQPCQVGNHTIPHDTTINMGDDVSRSCKNGKFMPDGRNFASRCQPPFEMIEGLGCLYLYFRNTHYSYDGGKFCRKLNSELIDLKDFDERKELLREYLKQRIRKCNNDN